MTKVVGPARVVVSADGRASESSHASKASVDTGGDGGGGGGGGDEASVVALPWSVPASLAVGDATSIVLGGGSSRSARSASKQPSKPSDHHHRQRRWGHGGHGSGALHGLHWRLALARPAQVLPFQALKRARAGDRAGDRAGRDDGGAISSCRKSARARAPPPPLVARAAPS